LSSDAAARRQSLGTSAVPGKADESFYVAINNKELDRRYFLSAFMKQAFHGGVQSGAAGTLGTLMVTVRVQNGKLFVFDAQDGRRRRMPCFALF
jgi:hypothetical protein